MQDNDFSQLKRGSLVAVRRQFASAGFTSDDGGFSTEQLAFLQVFLRRTSSFDMGEPLGVLCLSSSQKAREV
jgi:hypothetical protein